MCREVRLKKPLYSQCFLPLQWATVKLLWCMLNPLATWRWAPGEQEEFRGQHWVVWDPSKTISIKEIILLILFFIFFCPLHFTHRSQSSWRQHLFSSYSIQWLTSTHSITPSHVHRNLSFNHSSSSSSFHQKMTSKTPNSEILYPCLMSTSKSLLQWTQACK